MEKREINYTSLKTFFTEIEKILNFIWKDKRLQIATTVLKESNNAGEIIILYFKFYSNRLQNLNITKATLEAPFLP